LTTVNDTSINILRRFFLPYTSTSL